MFSYHESCMEVQFLSNLSGTVGIVIFKFKPPIKEHKLSLRDPRDCHMIDFKPLGF